MNIFTAFRRYAAQVLILGMAWALMGAASAPKDWWIALANDQVSQVQNGLRRGVDPNAVTPGGMPALMQAVRDEAWKSFDLLLAQRKIDVNVVNPIDETPLMYLAVVGQTDRAAKLIAKGAQVNRLGWTALHYAASRGHADTVRLLLKHKAIVNAPGPDGTTPLMMAAYGGSEEVVRILLEAGADITARNLDSMTAVEWAQRKKHNALAAKLEDLTQRVLDKRAALRNEAQGKGGATAAPGQAPNGRESPSRQAQTQQQTRQQPPRTPQQPQEAQESGSSPYFDLERFERDDGDQW